MSTLGQQGEDLVARQYQNLGYQILARNYIFPYGKQVGELDLVCRKGQELAFVEVKTRRNDKFGDVLESVNFSKQRKLVKMVKLYLLANPVLGDCDYRIDVATVDIDRTDNPVIIFTNAIEDTN